MFGSGIFIPATMILRCREY